ncbi:acetyl-CoA synthetase [Sphaerisporangium krabiense]|uniref:2-aminobenzoate-CoA ligase n=1 Tax=Sphaerisporangium krabiense TaxID=763782 RepID=A0A7W8ZBN5_9ACTN|nr:AMP-binding protein [Sphaerisporangium krabiense]MBB5631051.1 2-aminobenzoate-CoA ligase [Sphaerisporangium krabiense]GII65934.1 acetyl-CoA synthetase [Sphaerisporangium krabiense]
MFQGSAHVDTFVLDRLPPRSQWPEFGYELPDLRLPDRLNCAQWLLDDQVARGAGPRPCLIGEETSWSYAELQAAANRVAAVLRDDLGVVPGNRVLLLGPNTPMLVACWYAVMKAGGVAVTLVPHLKAREIAEVARHAAIEVALCDRRSAGELVAAGEWSELSRIAAWGAAAGDAADAGGGLIDLDGLMAERPDDFATVPTFADDPCLIAFTSGSTGRPKAAVHTHREVAAMCACFQGAALNPAAGDVFTGSAPIAFTFGLLALACYPIHCGGSVVLLEKGGPEPLLRAVERHAATFCFTVPTVYRTWLRDHEGDLARRLPALRVAVSSGELLPAATWLAFREATGISLVNVLGSTEMLHGFMSTGADPPRPGSVGKPVRGYRATILGADGTELKDGRTGLLAVKGPTGCRYLDDARQAEQVRDGWNLTGDLARRDADGYFWLEGRSDDVIVSAGYNISAMQVEETLLEHPQVRECAVVPRPDGLRGHVVKAYVVPGEGMPPGEEGARALQAFVTERIAGYKSPRVIEFLDRLPRTANGKIARQALRHRSAGHGQVRLFPD